MDNFDMELVRRFPNVVIGCLADDDDATWNPESARTALLPVGPSPKALVLAKDARGWSHVTGLSAATYPEIHPLLRGVSLTFRHHGGNAVVVLGMETEIPLEGLDRTGRVPLIVKVVSGHLEQPPKEHICADQEEFDDIFSGRKSFITAIPECEYKVGDRVLISPPDPNKPGLVKVTVTHLQRMTLRVVLVSFQRDGGQE